MKFQSLISYCILASIVIVFSGCTCKEKPVYINTTCPKFTKHIDIKVTRINNESASISWTDIQKLKDLSTAQKKFNAEVNKMNLENEVKMKEALIQN
jgi:hypothetical protein